MLVNNALEIHGVHKRYGTLHVLRGIDLVVAQGEAFGLLGPNGAGKSTLSHIILGILRAEEGTIHIFGSPDIEAQRRRLGYLPERPRYHTQFTAREYLTALGRLSDRTGLSLHNRVEAVIDLLGMQNAADRRIGTYSKGMLQRLGLAQAVLHEPELLIVDEPASALDPAGQREMVELLRMIQKSGCTLLLCTHRLAEVETICDRVGVLAKGRLDSVTSLSDLRAQGHSVTIQVRDLPAETASVLAALRPGIRCTRTEVIIFPTSEELLARILRILLEDDVAIVSVVPEVDALEQFYFQAINTPDHPPDSGDADAGQEAPVLETLMQGDQG